MFTTKIKSTLGIALAVTALASAGSAVDRAQAMNPAQSTEAGVVNMLGGYVSAYSVGSIDDFWRRTLPAWGAGYSKPAIKYYGTGAGGYYNTATCGSTYPVRGENGMYCPGDGTIYLDYWGQQGLLNNHGDHGAGGFLAHEWAHRAQHHLRTMRNDFRGEYNADCMAGLYTRFGYNTGRLSGNDLWEFNSWLAKQPASVSHGLGSNRALWFQYGYNQYSKAACDQVFNLTTSGVRSKNDTRLRPPVLSKVDLTPPASDALPTAKGSKKVITPRSLRVKPTTPIVS
jgi:predicted metalloprotease